MINIAISTTQVPSHVQVPAAGIAARLRCLTVSPVAAMRGETFAHMKQTLALIVDTNPLARLVSLEEVPV